MLCTSTMRPARSTIAPQRPAPGCASARTPQAGHASRSRPPCWPGLELGCGSAGNNGSRVATSRLSIVAARARIGPRGDATGGYDGYGIHARRARLARGSRARRPLLPLAPSARRFSPRAARAATTRRRAQITVRRRRRCSKQMSVARIVRTMDFGAMMSLTYMLDRAQRDAVARLSRRAGARIARRRPSAFCAERTVAVGEAGRGRLERLESRSRRTRAISPRPVSRAAQLGRLQREVGVRVRGRRERVCAARRARRESLRRQRGRRRSTRSTRAAAASTGITRPTAPCAPRCVVAPLDAGGARHAVLFGDQAGRFYAVAAETRGAALARTRPTRTRPRSSRARRSRATASSMCRSRPGKRAGR